MAIKATYMYQVTMGHGDKEERVAYCYARNSGRAVDGMKQIFAEDKYDSFSCKMFGEADFRVHPEPFMPMSRDEVEIISKNNLANAAAYSQRKNVSVADLVQALPAGGEFIPVNTKGD